MAFRILVPRSEIEPGPSAVEAQGPNHWTRENSSLLYFSFHLLPHLPCPLEATLNPLRPRHEVTTLVSCSFSSVQLLSHVRLSAVPWTAACQASLSITWSLLKLMPSESVMPSNHLILCHPLLLPPSVSPRIRAFFQGVGPLHQVVKVSDFLALSWGFPCHGPCVFLSTPDLSPRQEISLF